MYKLRMVYLDADGNWAEIPHPLVLNIKPPFWDTLVFKVVLIIFGLSILFLYIRLRTWVSACKKILEN